MCEETFSVVIVKKLLCGIHCTPFVSKGRHFQECNPRASLEAVANFRDQALTKAIFVADIRYKIMVGLTIACFLLFSHRM